MAPPPVPLRVESVELQNVGPFKALEIEFPPAPVAGLAEVHILTGINGSGKSTLLHAIAGCLAPAARAALEKRFHQGLAVAIATINGVDLNWYNGEPTSYALPPRGSDPYVDRLCQALANSSSPTDTGAFYYSGARHIPDARASMERPMTSPQPLRPLQNAMAPDVPINHQALLNWIFENRVRSLLAGNESGAHDRNRYEANLQTVTQLLGDITEQSFIFEIDRDSFAVQIKGAAGRVALDVLPDGLKSMVAWIGDLMRRLELIGKHTGKWAKDIPLLLLLDEIDIHLHPRWQRRILPAVQKAFPAAQIILTTHSPFVVGSVEHAWVYRLDPAHTTCTARPSRAGDSLETILEEVFGVPEIFDVHTHRLFEQFYAEKRKVLTQGALTPELQELAETLSARGDEVQDIVSRELAQLRRIQQQAQARVAD